MRFNDLLHLAAFPGKAHGRPPASGFVATNKMPESRALSKFSDQFQPLHTPVRGAYGGMYKFGDLEGTWLSGAFSVPNRRVDRGIVAS